MVWNKNTGKPYFNAIVWQDTRTDKICNELAKEGGQDRFRAKVGLPAGHLFLRPQDQVDPGQRRGRPLGR
jgi:glycerol kinase